MALGLQKSETRGEQIFPRSLTWGSAPSSCLSVTGVLGASLAGKTFPFVGRAMGDGLGLSPQSWWSGVSSSSEEQR